MLVQWGDASSIPHLIHALTDESAHVGVNYPDAGMATTRYWAAKSLSELTGLDFGFKWDDTLDRRNASVLRWMTWYQTVVADRPRAMASPVEDHTLQYRVARDAFAPSRFVAVIDGGISPPLELIWDLPKSEAQTIEKARFDELIQSLEAEQINGVEFTCSGEWIQQGSKLRVTTVPKLTDAGRNRVQDSGR
jgi:hypothetical protein